MWNCVWFNLNLYFRDREFPILSSSPVLAMTFSSQLESLFTTLLFKIKELIQRKRVS